MADLKKHQGMRRQPQSSEELLTEGDFLSNFVAGGVLPELMRSYARDHHWPSQNEPEITEQDISLFFDIVNSGDHSRMSAAVSALRSKGLTCQQLLLDLLGPVAQEFGKRWTADETDFSSLSIGIGHLQALRRMISQIDDPHPISFGPPRRALLASAPGEQHDFGVMIVDHFLHVAGWDVRTCPGAKAEEILEQVTKNSFEIAGLSLSCEAYLLPLERLVAGIKRVSKNSEIGILVGGQLFVERPELALLIGADATARDGRDAVRQAEAIAVRKGVNFGNLAK
jgi:methanogenic corrinoid protein MtbC1